MCASCEREQWENDEIRQLSINTSHEDNDIIKIVSH
jgi:hypothetical protein